MEKLRNIIQHTLKTLAIFSISLMASCGGVQEPDTNAVSNPARDFYCAINQGNTDIRKSSIDQANSDITTFNTSAGEGESVISFRFSDTKYYIVDTKWGNDYSLKWYLFDSKTKSFNEIVDPLSKLSLCKKALSRGLQLQYQINKRSGLIITIHGRDKINGNLHDDELTVAHWNGQEFILIDEEYDFN